MTNTVSIFDSILAQATAGATTGTTENAYEALLNEFGPFNGDTREPSEGFVLPVAPLTKSLYTYQEAAVETILNHRRVLLGLQPGMGKTAIMQAVAAAVVATGGKVLVTTPPSLRVSPWAEEFAADYPHLTIAVVEGTKAAALPNVDVVIIGDSVIAKREADIIAWDADAVFADEAHRFKTRNSKRAIALHNIVAALDASAITVLATGTLATNNAADVWKPLSIIGQGVNEVYAKKVSGGASYTRFMDHWCETEVIWNGRANIRVAKGCKDALGLRASLMSTCMINVPRDEVLDLPARTFDKLGLVLNGDAREYRRIEKDFLSWVREQHGDAAAKRASKAEAVTKIMRLWEQDGLAKVNATAEYVENLTEQGEQVVVMAWHSKVIVGLYNKLTASGLRCATIAGGASSDHKAAVVRAFQAGQIDVVIGQIEAAGTGLTLTAASNIVFAQLPWSPASFAQACDRIYRIGQTHKVVVHILNGHGMVSEKLWDVLVRKAEVVDAINNGKPTTIDQGSVQDAVLESFGW